MTREQYESLSLAALRDLARARNMKHISSLRKAELVEAMLAQDELDKAAARREAPAQEAAAPRREEPAQEAAVSRREETARAREISRREEPARVRETSRREESPRVREGSRREEPAQAGQNARQEESPRAAGPQAARQEEASRKNPVGSRPVRNGKAPAGDNRTGYMGKNQAGAAQPSSGQGGQGTRTPHSQESQRPQVQERRQSYEERQAPEERGSGDRPPMDLSALDSGNRVSGILEVMQDGYGFLRSDNYMSGDNDVYVAPSQIRKFGLRTGDYVSGNTRIRAQQEKFSALLYVQSVNGMAPSEAARRPVFENLTPIFPDHRIRMERTREEVAMRIVDLISPIGRGQRGMIVSPPKAGKTTLLKDIARSILTNDPEMHIIIMLIDERPEEVTDIREAIVGQRVEVLDSTFDKEPDHHIKVAEMGIARAKRLVEYGQNVTILLDSITRLARASNVTIQPSGRTLSGGLDPMALSMPKRFFGAARNMREGGSLTILATALIDTGSKMDDVIYEEFKGTGNMELVLDRKLSERRVFPAIDIQKSGTRREDLLLDPGELDAVYIMRRALNGLKGEEAAESILNMFVRTRDNEELVRRVRAQKYI